MRLISMLAPPASVQTKSQGHTPLGKRILALRTRIDLKLFFRDAGLSRSEASAKVRELFNDDGATEEGAAAKDQPLSVAGVARAFRDIREREKARRKFLLGMVDERAARAAAAAIPTPANCRVKSEDYWLSTVEERMAAELDEELKACADADVIEAKLVRLDWPDEAIREFVGEFGPGAG